MLKLFSIRSLILYYALRANYIRYVGYTAVDKCSFCESEPETLPHFFFHCVYSQLSWKQFESYYYSLTKEFVHLTLQDVLIGIITSKCPLLNCLLLIAKVYLWDCRRSETLPNITGLKLKVKNIYVLKTIP